MGKDTPRYFVTIKGSHYWQPSPELRREGWTSEPLGKDRGAGVSRAVAINAEVDAWYAAGKPARGSVTSQLPARRTSPGTCAALFDLYQHLEKNPDYPTNKNTKRQYDAAVAYLRKWIGPVPAKAVTPRMALLRYRELARKTPAQAASIMRVARAAFGKARFLVDPGHALYIAKNDNPFLALDLKGSDSEGRLWTREERDAMVKAAFESNSARFPSIGVAIALNWWLGQREGDILALGRTVLDGQDLVIRQNKTTRRVHLPVGILPAIKPLFERALEIQKTLGVESLTHLLLDESTGEPWDEHAFRKRFRQVREAAGCDDELQFMHLRHTAIVNMQDAGCEISEIAAVSGHTLQSVHTILERYGRRTRKQAENAIRKRMALEEGESGGGTG